MYLSERILGSDTVKRLHDRQTQAILVIGDDHFTRGQLAKIDCFNFAAAERLSRILNTELKVKNTKDVFNRIPPSALALPGLGVFSLATLGAAFEAMKLGTLMKYIEKHRHDGQAIVTFNTLKSNSLDTKAAARERKDTKARKHGRNAQAHEHRVRRHIERHPTTRRAAIAN